MKKLNLLFVCGNGLGSSLAAQMSAGDVLDSMGVKAKLDHSDLASARSKQADIIVSASNFKSRFEAMRDSLGEDIDIIYLDNIVSKPEFEEKITPVLVKHGVL